MLHVFLNLGCTSLIHMYGECESDAECAQALGTGAVCLGRWILLAESGR